MKTIRLLIIALILLSGTLNFAVAQQSQNLTPPLPGTESYDITKQAGELNAFQVTSIPALQIPEIPFGFKLMQNSGSRADNCYIPHDTATYTPLNRNDDGSSAAIALPFTFNMYGNEYTSVFINNNGNITFNNPISGYTAAGFPIPTPMIAPFWADVDTRPADSEVVWYKVTPTALYVTYPGVGYYNRNTDKVNTFQVIITNGSDPVIGVGNNVAFNYGDMQWTTGTASGGTNGFLGAAATVGVNSGNNVNFFQIGRFRQPGDGFVDAYDIDGGIDWLDNKCFVFNLNSDSVSNVSPILLNISATSATICAGDTSDINFTFSGPESDQEVTVSLVDPANTGSVVSSTISGASTQGVLSLTGMVAGTYSMQLIATDNGDPVASTTIDIELIVEDCDIEYDCIQYEANVGDPCELPVMNGVLNEDCVCVPVVIPECEFVYFLADHDAADGISDIYEVTLSGGIATMTYIATSDIEVHIAYKAEDKLIYAISKHTNSYRTLDPATAAWGPVVNLNKDLGQVTAAVFNADGKLLLGSQNHNVIYSMNAANAISVYDTYSPLSGGDLAFSSDGMLYMATRSGNGLYEVWTAPTNDNLIGSLPAKVTGMAITDADELLISAQGNTSLVVYNTAGANTGTAYDLMLNGVAYTLRDGDMASGCRTPDDEPGYCENFTTFLANHGAGINGSDIYEVNFFGGNANLTFLTNVEYETHIAFDATSNILYLLNVDGSFVRAYDVTLNAFMGDIPITGSFTKLTAVVFNPNDGLLYAGDHWTDEIYTIDPADGSSAYFADGPVSGGDLEILDDGTLYLGTKEGAALYEIVPGGSAIFLGNMVPSVTGMARANNFSNSFITSENGASELTRISATDGSSLATYPIILGGNPFILTDGDMSAGCADVEPSIETGDCHATEVIEYVQGTSKNGGAIAPSRTDASNALGVPERVDELVFVSLGYGGSLTLAFDGAIPNGPGADIEIVETSFGNPTCGGNPEYADVSVSVNGIDWHDAGTVCRTNGFIDLDDVDGGSLAHVYFVKITNNNTLSTSPDGFDVDGVVAIHNCIDDADVPPTNPFIADGTHSVLSTYPNPTKGSSKVVFTTGQTTRTLIEVYDINGRNVATLYNQEAIQGKEYTLDFNGNNLPNGVYIYRMTTDNETIVEKFMIAR